MNKKDFFKNSFSVIWEIIKTILIISVFVIIIRGFIIQPFYVIGSSMEPNFYEGEYLIINELKYHILKPQRGDVVVLKHPEPSCSAFMERSFLERTFISITNFFSPSRKETCKNYIKRVIALPKEEIEIKDGEVKIYNNDYPEGIELDESYIPDNTQTLGSQKIELGENEYFVLGDNREPNASSDSREWGPLPRNYMVGKVWFRLFPISDKEIIPMPEYNI